MISNQLLYGANPTPIPQQYVDERLMLLDERLYYLLHEEPNNTYLIKKVIEAKDFWLYVGGFHENH